MNELLGCPFCGGSDVKLRHHHAGSMSWVSCVGCGLEAPSETGVTDEQAVEYWNRRALSAGQAQPVATERSRFTSPLAGAVRKKVDKELAHLRESVLRSAEGAPETAKSEWPHLIQLCRTLGLFASVIKSGEPWTATCQTEYDFANTAAKEIYSELNERSAAEATVTALQEALEKIADEPTLGEPFKSENRIMSRDMMIERARTALTTIRGNNQ